MSKPQLNDQNKRGPIAWMSHNPVAANLIMFVLLLGGIVFIFNSKQEIFPEFDIDLVSTNIMYPGASPEEVENGIVLVVEEAIRGVDGIEEVTSTAGENYAHVMAEVLITADVQQVYQDIKSAVDRITTLPEDAERPEISIISLKNRVLDVIVSGDVTEKQLRETTEQIRYKLLESPGITQVELGWTKPLEIAIEIPQDTLRSYNLTLDQVAARIKQSAIELPGGSIKTAAGEILLRMDERRDYGSEFHEIPIITTPNGTILKLKDIAIIKDEFSDIDQTFILDGNPALAITVYRVGNETPIGISDAVKTQIVEIEKTLPVGMNLSITEDMSVILKQRINLLLRNACIGLALVFGLLGLFLEVRLAFWVMMGIPISFLGSFLFLPAGDISINMISLFAFIIALGIVVDDAIVVGESVYEYHQQGLPFQDAAIKGARDIAVPITFSVLTNIVAFIPMALVPGPMGKMFRVIPFVVISVFAISLFESLYILPAHLAHQREGARTRFGKKFHALQQSFSHAFVRTVKTVYHPFIKLCLNTRYIILAISIATLFILFGVIGSKRVAITFMPRVESDVAQAVAVLPYGSPIESSEVILDQIVQAANDIVNENGAEQLLVGSRAMIANANEITVIIELTDADTRPITTEKFTELWRQRVGTIPGLESLTFAFDLRGPGAGKSLSVQLSHSNLEILRKASAELAQAIEEFPVASGINDGFLPGKSQLSFTMTPQGQAVGLTSSNVARQVRNAFYGSEVLRQQRGRNEIKVMVRLPESERISITRLDSLLLRTPQGNEIPLQEAVNISTSRAYTTIDRKDGHRIITVTSNVSPDSETSKIIDSLLETTLPSLTQHYPGLTYSFDGREQDRQESMQALGLGFILAVFCIYALLAIPFKSYLQPLIIMAAIPFGIVGAVIGHIIMSYDLSLMSMMGIVALSGVVVNDSLVLIHTANQLHKQGYSAYDAVCYAGIRRFRPILLTTLTTFFGLAPMIFETSIQAKFLIPMAISLGFGILFATLISLILVPCLFLIIEDLKDLFLGKPVGELHDETKLEELLAN
ncbi:Multidrug resistance protein MdtC [Poriferisphaera corsica]|uniref:Multidrug resistance protein MdtC n=1 Tax=Poriferisphaera corsica TaxID=2528020 RepID=A0A517YY21_9BACT|nr:efflux RND transporter permease subunit [Poriferisphaera corsica]QDU35099.1 Multidrug resistance protein MdtC [Poriferisphaera corsica]